MQYIIGYSILSTAITICFIIYVIRRNFKQVRLERCRQDFMHISELLTSTYGRDAVGVKITEFCREWEHQIDYDDYLYYQNVLQQLYDHQISKTLKPGGV
jgi:hypothetical protein